MSKSTPTQALGPFRRAVLRGLAIVMPPLLTIVLFIWAWSVIESYILVPSESVAAKALVWYYQEVMDDYRRRRGDEGDELSEEDQKQPAVGVTLTREDGVVVSFVDKGKLYTADGDGKFMHYPSEEYIKKQYLPRYQVLPCFIALFLIVLYLLGKLVAAGVGRIVVGSFDGLIHRLPLISNVYSSVKQVTDFVFTERDIEFNRVVAIEYPRKGIWSIGFVTGESMLDIRSAANESVLSVLMPTSPMPMTGFTVTVLKSEAIDLNLTVDQAIQFIISCGVVVPPQQQTALATGVAANLAKADSHQGNGSNGQDRAESDTEPQRKIGEPSE
jgi:uncharacterized membrane protein